MDDRADRRRFDKLPEPVDPSTIITSKESAPVQDPERGRDTDRDAMLRYAGL
jgi:hypothetical protein